MKINFTEYKGLVIVVKESYYGRVYEFNGVEYKRFCEVTYAVDIWLEEGK